MNEWTRGDLIALFGIIVAVLVFVSQEILKRSKRSLARNIIIQTPRNQESTPIMYDENLPIRKDIVGTITGFTQKEIERLGLYVEILVKTDRWYPQGKSMVQADGGWKIVGRFGGTRHIIRAELKDNNGVKYKTKEIEVIVSS